MDTKCEQCTTYFRTSFVGKNIYLKIKNQRRENEKKLFREKLDLQINFHKNTTVLSYMQYHSIRCMFFVFLPVSMNEKVAARLKCDTCQCESAHKTAKPQKNINYALHFSVYVTNATKCLVFARCFHSRHEACLLPAFL